MDSSSMDFQPLSMIAVDLCRWTFHGEWNEVVTAYKYNATIHTMPVNSDKDTALHVAANENNAITVKQLVDEIKQTSSAVESLKTKNVEGDTALHRAASIGSLEMCEWIIEADHHRHQGHVLIEERNNNGETPLFLAALNGHNDVFFYLQSRCADKSLVPCRRASDGQTVLHCTLYRDYFGIYVKRLRSTNHQSKSQQTARPRSTADTENPIDYNCEHGMMFRKIIGHVVTFSWHSPVLLFELMFQNSQELVKVGSGSLNLTRCCLSLPKNGVLEIVKKILEDKPGANPRNELASPKCIACDCGERQPHVFEHLKKYLKEKMLWGKPRGTCRQRRQHYPPLGRQALASEALAHCWFCLANASGKLNGENAATNAIPPKQKHKTPQDIFVSEHKELLKQGNDWLKSTSESCSVVAALIAGVAFARPPLYPAVRRRRPEPYLERHSAFNLFAFTSLLALFCSITSLITFLSILTLHASNLKISAKICLQTSFGVELPLGVHRFRLGFFLFRILLLLREHLQQLPLYIDLTRAIFFKVPQSSNRESEKLIL
ncbi:uncharacterized protein LOC129304681 [Prosopis cineraria]|uniref:uncharacterized protein LOC129304681 n=1 Tax=Prosopis cineraria TaxID=364024 RepID=UPI00241078B7|nr:uncharacterized protein LOC129304681 [Prosopis cineraria]